MMTATEATSVLSAVGAHGITEGRMSSDLVYWARGTVGHTPVHLHDHEWGTVVCVGGEVSTVEGGEPGSVEMTIRVMLGVA